MIDSTDAAVMERALTYCQGKSILNSINLEDGLAALREGGAAGAALRRRAGGRADRREGDGGHRRAQARGGAAQLRDPDRGDGHRARGHLVGRAGLPLRHRRRQLPRLGGADDRGRARRSRREFPRHQDDPRRLQRQLRPAGRRPRGAQLGLPLPLHPGRARRGDRQHRAAGALRRDPGRGAPARRGAALPASSATSTAGDRGGRGASPRSSAAARRPPRRGAAPRPAARASAWRAPSSRARKEGLEDDLDAGARRSALAGAARHHQRPADGRACARSAGCSTTTS